MKRFIKTTGWLAMAAALTLGTAACSSSDDSIAEQQPVNPTAPKTYTMTVQVTKGDAAATRGLSLDGKTLNVKWNEGEMVYVLQQDKDNTADWNYVGKLTAAASSNATTTLSGTLTVETGESGIDLATDAPALRFVLHGNALGSGNASDYSTGQNGLLTGTGSIEEKYDFASCDLAKGSYTIDTEAKTVSVTGGITLVSEQAIVKFSLYQADGTTPINATSLAITSTGDMKKGRAYESDATTITTQSVSLTGLEGSTNNLYVALCNYNATAYTLTATDAEGNTYTYGPKTATFTDGQYYEVKVKMNMCQYVDLSMVDNAGNAREKQWTANCYMVHTAGAYKLPLVYGNAIKDGAANSAAWTGVAGNNTTATFPNHAGTAIDAPWITKATTGEGVAKGMGITVASAALLWQDAQGLITQVGISGDYLTLTVGKDATTQQGNALVAAKDADGNIVWSWHIWVTTETFATLTTVATGSHDYQVTPVNLGWVPTGGSGKQGYNTYYQWGRKDAFIPGTWNANTNRTVYDISNTAVTGLNYMESTTATIADNIKNPTTHYYNSSTYGPCNTTYYNMWDAQQTGTGNIAMATKKTVYDPCPAGFCVPTNNLFYFMSNNGSFRTMTTWDGTNKGATWDTSITGNALFFPASGYRIGSSGTLGNVGSDGFYWSASPLGGNYGRSLYFSSGRWNWGNFYHRAFGFPLRAVKE